MLTVQRVHWLRSAAQYARWAEELSITEHEMEWTTRWFLNRLQCWTVRRDAAAANRSKPGHVAYAEKQMAMWLEFAVQADTTYTLNNPTYIRLTCEGKPDAPSQVAGERI